MMYSTQCILTKQYYIWKKEEIIPRLIECSSIQRQNKEISDTSKKQNSIRLP